MNTVESEELVSKLRKETNLRLDSQSLDIQFCDDVIENILGYSAKEILQKSNLSQYIHADDRDFSVEIFSHALFGPQVRNFRNRLIHKNGSIVTASWDAVLVNGVWHCLLNDISELIKIESILQAERRRFETILETVSEVVFLIDLNERCVFVNSVASEVLGVAPRDMLWRHIGDVLNISKKEKRDELNAALKMKTRGKAATKTLHLELEHTKPSGEEVTLSLYLKPMLSPEQELLGKVGTIRDVSLLKRQQSDLIQASKMMSLGEMAGGVAHEINNPLAIINGRAGQLKEVLGDDPIDVQLALQMLNSIESTTLRIAKIVKGLKTFSRDAENDPFELVTLGNIIEDTLSFCRERFKQHGVLLEAVQQSPDLILECRPTQISQALLNLLNNAYDAVEGQKEKWVRVLVEEDGECVLIKVTDSGPGIPAEIRSKILQPFFTTKDVGKGTGLGLSISRGIVNAHSGEMTFDARHKNTCFVIRLPKRQCGNKIVAS